MPKMAGLLSEGKVIKQGLFESWQSPQWGSFPPTSHPGCPRAASTKWTEEHISKVLQHTSPVHWKCMHWAYTKQWSTRWFTLHVIGNKKPFLESNSYSELATTWPKYIGVNWCELSHEQRSQGNQMSHWPPGIPQVQSVWQLNIHI